MIAYHIHDGEAPALLPGQGQRPWMNETSERFAYRCLPLSIANCTGWELRLPCRFTAFWNGGPKPDDVKIIPEDDIDLVHRTATGHFGFGTLTFHTGYLFRTSPGWGLLARGAPNSAKHGIAPLDGLIETDWLPFGFTMNWRFTAPGQVTFERDDVFCFIMPVPHLVLDDIRPIIQPLASQPQLKHEYETWAQSRADFIAKLQEKDPAVVAEGWQRHYIQGKKANGELAGVEHISKRKLADFKRV
ncbi:MAG: hypothetical protein EBQ89_10215 [Alphaproteobacteria bacterium]|nr:hypothetical protein [Alphaproteobacteria bacterium]